MSSRRTSRIAEEIKKELSQIIREEIKDYRVKGLISITGVEVTNDLRYAKIYVSKLGDMEDISTTLEGLEKAAGYLRSELAKRLRLRLIPELIFKGDTSLEHGARINKILSGIMSSTETGEQDD